MLDSHSSSYVDRTDKTGKAALIEEVYMSSHMHDGDAQPVHLAELREHLQGMEFPADKSQLIDYAQQRNAPSHIINTLQQLLTSEFGSPNARPMSEYQSLDDLIHEIERTERTD